MPDRAASIDALLQSAGWNKAKRIPLAGDLSSRRYTRLVQGDKTAILMDAGANMTPFLTMTRWLADHGFSVPEVFSERAGQGLILLEDLGDISLTKHLESAAVSEIDPLCVDLLLELRATPAPDLPAPDAETLVEWTHLADEHYPGAVTTDLAPFREILYACLTEALKAPLTLSLRDFHADNLMWLANRSDTARLGLLDYQDAFLTNPCYDLVSYLTDARTEVAPSRRADVLTQYLSRSGDESAAFRMAFAAFSAQRNLRILGIFTKSAAMGKAHHLSKLPRVYGYFTEALHHTVFDKVREQTLAALPDPTSVLKAYS